MSPDTSTVQTSLLSSVRAMQLLSNEPGTASPTCHPKIPQLRYEVARDGKMPGLLPEEANHGRHFQGHVAKGAGG